MIVTDTMPAGFDRRRAFVPTMGALHDGHRQLMRVARERIGSDGDVVVSVFVNPLQFGANEDFDAYPRTIDADIAACEAEGVDILYIPTVERVYGSQPTITVHPGKLGEDLEGASRPGHFAGMLTVVAILLHQVSPDVAIFGEKDYQQLELIRRMCGDLAFPYSILGVETVREADGVARSSRNVYLSEEDRLRAGAIPRALEDGVAAGALGAEGVKAAATAPLVDAGLSIDYVEVRGPDLGEPPASGEARLLIAVHAGATRLIDNCRVVLGEDDAT